MEYLTIPIVVIGLIAYALYEMGYIGNKKTGKTDKPVKKTRKSGRKK